MEETASLKDADPIGLADLPLVDTAQEKAPAQQTWGWVLDLYDPLLEPGGKKSKQLGAFGVLKKGSPGGYLAKRFSPETVVRTQHLEQVALHTTESLLAHKVNPNHPLIPPQSHGRGYELVIQRINYLASQGVEAATHDL